MNEIERKTWQAEVLDRIFELLAAAPDIAESLIFKGARVLNLHLGPGSRQSYDLDSNLSNDFLQRYPQLDDQRRWLEAEIFRHVHRGFEREDPVRYRLDRITVEARPPRSHPRGWDAFKVILGVLDNRRPSRGLPRLEIDVVAPEELSETSVVSLDHSGHLIRAYSLERIAGEKPRAFLQSLPAYITKIDRKPRSQRVKDVYDLARILNARPISDKVFWEAAGRQFRLACRSRFVDCSGIATFEQELTATRMDYEQSKVLPKDIGFDEAWTGLRAIIGLWTDVGIVPLEFPLPEKG
ncbi:MAG: nucleotidyl transferase AbiEii/AbiGii toxin family protein [Thermoanaerobaculia bacterium]|nr:nucleotidyl transferase AbiEii/AbiGii toxin family protein [Thermoanaerobaculia bacterium]